MNDSRAAHPSDEVLLAWSADLGTDPATNSHVQHCPKCAARVAQWQAQLEAVESALRAAPDGLFSDAALARQGANLMRRLRGEPKARVLQFPAAPVETRRERTGLGSSSRWVAAAALIGLLAGGSAARLFDPHVGRPFGTQSARGTTAPVRPVQPVLQNTTDAVADEAFLVELDAALVSRAPEPLRVLDALTPERDTANRPR